MIFKFRVTLHTGTVWPDGGGLFDTFDEAQNYLMENEPKEKEEQEAYWYHSTLEEVAIKEK